LINTRGRGGKDSEQKASFDYKGKTAWDDHSYGEKLDGREFYSRVEERKV